MTDPATSLSILAGTYSGVAPWVINLERAIIIFLLSLVIGKIVNLLLKKLFIETELDKHFANLTGKRMQVGRHVANVISVIIYIIGAIWALVVLGIINYIVSFLGVIVILALVGGMFLSIRDFLPNFVAGMILKSKHLLKVGDQIRIRNVEGIIVSMNMLSVAIQTKDDDYVVIPNAMFQQEMLQRKPKQKK